MTGYNWDGLTCAKTAWTCSLDKDCAPGTLASRLLGKCSDVKKCYAACEPGYVRSGLRCVVPPQQCQTTNDCKPCQLCVRPRACFADALQWLVVMQPVAMLVQVRRLHPHHDLRRRRLQVCVLVLAGCLLTVSGSPPPKQLSTCGPQNPCPNGESCYAGTSTLSAARR